MLRTTALMAATGAVALLTLATSPATAQTSQTTQGTQAQSAAVCGQKGIKISSLRVVAKKSRIVITHRNAPVLEFPFNDSQPLRSLAVGTTLTTCGFFAGNGSNGYAGTCGSGYKWHAIRINAVNELGWPVTVGYIPKSCARVR